MSLVDTATIITAVAQAATLPLLGISLIYLAKQVRQGNEETRLARLVTQASLQQAVAQLILDMDRIFIENPELRSLLSAKSSQIREMKVDELHRCDALAEYVLDTMDAILEVYIEFDTDTRIAWENYIVDMFQTSLITRSFFERQEHWYTESLGSLYRQSLSR